MGPPQCVQLGGHSQRPPSGSSGTPGGRTCGRPQARQRGACRLPCRCTTWVLPARSCRSSTFCVTTVSRGTCRASSAMAWCAGLGSERSTFMRRHSYQPQTSSLSLRKASGVARSWASKRSHRPVSASRKVGILLSAETPAPVKITTCFACCRTLISSGGTAMGVFGFMEFWFKANAAVSPLVRRNASHVAPQQRSCIAASHTDAALSTMGISVTHPEALRHP